MVNSMYSGTGDLWNDIWAGRQSPSNTTPSLGQPQANNNFGHPGQPPGNLPPSTANSGTPSWSMLGPDGWSTSNDPVQQPPSRPDQLYDASGPLGMGGGLGDILGMGGGGQGGQAAQGGHTHDVDRPNPNQMALERQHQINSQLGGGLGSFAPPRSDMLQERQNLGFYAGQGQPSPFAGALGSGIFGMSRT